MFVDNIQTPYPPQTRLSKWEIRSLKRISLEEDLKTASEVQPAEALSLGDARDYLKFTCEGGGGVPHGIRRRSNFQGQNIDCLSGGKSLANTPQ